MPALKNPRHERMAQLLASGKSATDAYELAGYKRSHSCHPAQHRPMLMSDAVAPTEGTLPSVASTPDVTGRMQVWHDKQFKPGQSGNPAGRPRGSRNRLSEKFFDDMYEVWQEGGRDALRRTMQDRPEVFITVVARIIPKELLVRNDPLEEISHGEIADLIDQIRAAKAQLIAEAQLIESQSGTGAIEAPREVEAGSDCA
jgi:Family of unknown function (DUF5681)